LRKKPVYILTAHLLVTDVELGWEYRMYLCNKKYIQNLMRKFHKKKLHGKPRWK